MRLPRARWLALPAAALLGGCAGDDIIYQPAPQILPARIQRLAVRNVANKTHQFGLEDKLTLRIRDEFLRNGRYPVAPEASADGIVAVTLRRYVLAPTQFDAVNTPTVYKLRVIADLQFIERATNTALWEEEGLEGVQVYTAPTLSGGITEEQARELIWDTMARDIVKRTVEGFGSVTGASKRFIGEKKDDKKYQEKKPELEPKPVNPNIY